MNFFSWCLALSLLVLFLIKGAQFHRSLVCRQESWQMSFNLGTRALFSKALPTETTFHRTCKVVFVRKLLKVSWQKMPSLERKVFDLGLRGSI